MTARDVVNSYTGEFYLFSVTPGCTGQRCMAASVLLTIGSQQELVETIVKYSKEILAGQDSTGKMGPVIDEASKLKITQYIDQAEAAGAQILLDGRHWTQAEGWWVGPTVIKHKNKSDAALHEEIFGPVISIYECKDKEEAIEIENGNSYGNAACIYTASGAVAEWFTKRFSAGMLGVNIGVPVPRLSIPSN